MDEEVSDEGALQRVTQAFASLSSESSLVKLKLRGSLDGPLFDKLVDVQKALEDTTLYHEFDSGDLVRSVLQSDIDTEFTQGSFPYRLLTELAASDDDYRALQLAYELVMEARS